ncbi:MAG: glycosyltransferase [Chloroflexi bacterium]|nr:glycosyltransferase [Chloroflexota bacterium]
MTFPLTSGADSLRQILCDLLAHPDKVQTYKQLAQQRARTYYSWAAVTDAYERLFYQVCSRPLPVRLTPLPD